MPDAAFKNASAKRDTLAKEINSLQQDLHDRRAELKDVEEWLEKWHVYAGVGGGQSDFSDDEIEHSTNVKEPVEGDDSHSRPVAEKSRVTGNPKKEFVSQVARQIIEPLADPISRADLYRELEARGIVIEGKDREQVLSTMLWRTRKDKEYAVIRVPTGGYWLAERPHEASGYSPDSTSDGDQLVSAPTDEAPRDEDNSEQNINRQNSEYMRMASSNYLSELSLKERQALLNFYESEEELTSETVENLRLKYKELANESYVQGGGFQEIFLSQLRSSLNELVPTG